MRRAHAVHPLAAVQSEYSLFARDPETNGVLDTCRELGIGFVPYSPLGRGFLSGEITSVDDLARDDVRLTLPWFSPANIAHNVRVVQTLRRLAEAKGASTSQLALAWVIAQDTSTPRAPTASQPAPATHSPKASPPPVDSGDLSGCQCSRLRASPGLHPAGR
ncbi:aldo/keto reductase [Kribbella sp. NBC_01245]